ncbi:6-bladed beta-propeller, partial [Parabacteroides sp. AM08-6]|uniref:6-bladed beta-propeller n=1 Tax=Parabacteroides sp. AM08-6 TaxID=2292053 RepID=UPI001F1D7D30
TNDYVILSNTFNNACLFDRKSGQFIHNIGKQGGGPDEYYMLSSAGNFYKEKGLIYATRGNKWIGINIESNKVEDKVALPDIAKDGLVVGISNPYRLNDSLYIGYMNNLT